MIHAAGADNQRDVFFININHLSQSNQPLSELYSPSISLTLPRLTGRENAVMIKPPAVDRKRFSSLVASLDEGGGRLLEGSLSDTGSAKSLRGAHDQDDMIEQR